MGAFRGRPLPDVLPVASSVWNSVVLLGVISALVAVAIGCPPGNQAPDPPVMSDLSSESTMTSATISGRYCQMLWIGIQAEQALTSTPDRLRHRVRPSASAAC
jgi:hypothetical protein